MLSFEILKGVFTSFWRVFPTFIRLIPLPFGALLLLFLLSEIFGRLSFIFDILVAIPFAMIAISWHRARALETPQSPQLSEKKTIVTYAIEAFFIGLIWLVPVIVGSVLISVIFSTSSYASITNLLLVAPLLFIGFLYLALRCSMGLPHLALTGQRLNMSESFRQLRPMRHALWLPLIVLVALGSAATGVFYRVNWPLVYSVPYISLVYDAVLSVLGLCFSAGLISEVYLKARDLGAFEVPKKPAAQADDPEEAATDTPKDF